MSVKSNRIIMCVDLDYFYAQCEEVRNPSIKGKPVVVCVYSGRTEESGAVSTSNYVARNLGVKSGMPIAFAKKALSKYPEAVFLPMDNEYYDSISNQIMNNLRSKSSYFEQSSIDEAYLDITNESSGDYSKAYNLGKEIKAEILENENLTCSVGIGPNKLVSKMAVDSTKPDGLILISPEEVQVFLESFPIGKLFGIGPKTEEKLRSLGIETVGQLASFDRQVLAHHFGEKLGPQLQDSARGIDERPVREREVEQFSRIVTLKQNANSFNFQDVLRPLAKDLSDKLLAANLLCESIGIIAITSQLKTKTRVRKTGSLTSSESEILDVASSLFQSFFSDENLELGGVTIRRVGIRVASFVKNITDSKETNLRDFL